MFTILGSVSRAEPGVTWKLDKGAWHANLGHFNAKSEFGYCSIGDRVSARGNAQIRATTHFLWEE